MKATNTEARDESVAVVSVDSGMNTSEIAADPLAATKCAGTNTDHVSMCDIDMNTSQIAAATLINQSMNTSAIEVAAGTTHYTFLYFCFEKIFEIISTFFSM